MIGWWPCKARIGNVFTPRTRETKTPYWQERTKTLKDRVAEKQISIGRIFPQLNFHQRLHFEVGMILKTLFRVKDLFLVRCARKRKQKTKPRLDPIVNPKIRWYHDTSCATAIAGSFLFAVSKISDFVDKTHESLIKQTKGGYLFLPRDMVMCCTLVFGKGRNSDWKFNMDFEHEIRQGSYMFR